MIKMAAANQKKMSKFRRRKLGKKEIKCKWWLSVFTRQSNAWIDVELEMYVLVHSSGAPCGGDCYLFSPVAHRLMVDISIHPRYCIFKPHCSGKEIGALTTGHKGLHTYSEAQSISYAKGTCANSIPCVWFNPSIINTRVHPRSCVSTGLHLVRFTTMNFTKVRNKIGPKKSNHSE